MARELAHAHSSMGGAKISKGLHGSISGSTAFPGYLLIAHATSKCGVFAFAKNLVIGLAGDWI
jgi:hypothetical protein